MKRTLLIGCFGFLIGFFLSMGMVINGEHPTKEQEHVYIMDEIASVPRIIEVQYIENEEVAELIQTDEDQLEIISLRMQQELSEIDCIEDREEWFLAYKDIVFKYYKWFGAPETVFDAFTENEVELIFKTVETECYDADFDFKCNVTSVIFNRFESGKFGDSIEKVITAPNQFAYRRKNITESTILSVMYVYEIGDTTDGCVAFRSDRRPMKWRNWEYVFTDDAGHNFYK